MTGVNASKLFTRTYDTMSVLILAEGLLVQNVLHTQVWPLFFTVMLKVRMSFFTALLPHGVYIIRSTCSVSCHLPSNPYVLPCFFLCRCSNRGFHRLPGKHRSSTWKMHKSTPYSQRGKPGRRLHRWGSTRRSIRLFWGLKLRRKPEVAWWNS